MAPVRAQPANEGPARVPHGDRGFGPRRGASWRRSSTTTTGAASTRSGASRPSAGPDEPGAPRSSARSPTRPGSSMRAPSRRLIVASPTLTAAELGRLQQLARREGLALRLVARVPHMLTNRLTLQRVGPLMTVAVRPAELTGTQAALKRAFDISLASVAPRAIAADPARGGRAGRRHVAGSGALPAAARHPRQQALHGLQVPHDGSRCRPHHGRSGGRSHPAVLQGRRGARSRRSGGCFVR